MPELPEVETIRLGILPAFKGKKVTNIVVRDRRLRWPIQDNIQHLKGQIIEDITRRGKYLLWRTARGTLIVHLGMSGSFRILQKFCEAQKHDHLDVTFENGMVLRYTDPRRFGAILWTESDAYTHPLLAALGPEPLSDAFTADFLENQIRSRKRAIKSVIMDATVVVGVGNIYATEALFLAKIHPARSAQSLTKLECIELVAKIKQVLLKAIAEGGTTLRNFSSAEGKLGYFKHSLCIYGKAGKPCPRCNTPIESMVLAQRTTTFCPTCQANPI